MCEAPQASSAEPDNSEMQLCLPDSFSLFQEVLQASGPSSSLPVTFLGQHTQTLLSVRRAYVTAERAAASHICCLCEIICFFKTDQPAELGFERLAQAARV